ncbi:hypothetical protein A4A49_17397 [Nicotiana attenuata]|uniref:Uncharacterized protein n=1 Tax=Nicotiana attenuata TaxID=49451 RepID=A0A314KH83_NICAT|nr:hypothetical protein A4A49_17397 [Nicotiana attenuata]
MVVQQISFGKAPNNLLFLEDWDEEHQRISSKKIRAISKLKGTYRKYSVPSLQFSHNGLLFFRHSEYQTFTYSVINPITQEQLTFGLPFRSICAFFSHPVTKEHYLLWVRGLKSIEFTMLRLDLLVSNNLNSETGWKKSSFVPPAISFLSITDFL